MQKSNYDRLKELIDTADGMYYRLVLLVGEPDSGKSRILRELAKQYNVSVLNINLAISTELLELSTRKRSLKLPEILLGVATTEVNSPVFMDNTEILFDRVLNQDPLRLFQSISRNRTVVATWNGKTHDKTLIYASPEHPEYRRYESVDALIHSMN